MSAFSPLPGTAARRRLYLLRHGHVAYYDAEGKPLNPKLAALTDRGRAEAQAAGALLAGVPLDRVLCSGLARTRQTAELVAAPHGLPVEEHPDFLEIRAGRLTGVPKEQREAAYVYGFETAAEDGRFAGGDGFAAVRDRVVAAIEVLVRQPGWTHLVLVAHDGVDVLRDPVRRQAHEPAVEANVARQLDHGHVVALIRRPREALSAQLSEVCAGRGIGSRNRSAG